MSWESTNNEEEKRENSYISVSFIRFILWWNSDMNVWLLLKKVYNSYDRWQYHNIDLIFENGKNAKTWYCTDW
jgi:hypothetical protein